MLSARFRRLTPSSRYDSTSTTNCIPAVVSGGAKLLSAPLSIFVGAISFSAALAAIIIGLFLRLFLSALSRGLFHSILETISKSSVPYTIIDTVMLLLVTLILTCFGRSAQPLQTGPFWTAVKAHSLPNTCPPDPRGTWAADSSNNFCCYAVTATNTPLNAPETATPTTLSAKGQYGCCPTGYTCTGNVPAMLDWPSGTAPGESWTRSQ
jgi:hypothetical protein